MRAWARASILVLVAGCGSGSAGGSGGAGGGGGAAAGGGSGGGTRDAAADLAPANDAPAGQPDGASTDRGGAGGATADAGRPGFDAGSFPTTCEDLGPEPTIPAACATVLATKAVTGVTPSDESLDTAAIQTALNSCPGGQAVKLAADGDKTAFVSGALLLRPGVTLWIDRGVTLFASRNPRDFDAKAGQCAGNNTGSAACNGLIGGKNVANAAVMGAGTIDGRGGEPVVGDAAGSSWWALEELYDGKLAAPRLVQITNGPGFTLQGVTLKNAPKFHVVIEDTNGYKVWGITINTPASAPNTDGVDPSASTNGIIAYTKITTGDDNIAVKGSGPTEVNNLIVAHNHFGRGHGMSIGSETNGGVRNVKVCDLSLDGTDNGLRIKSDMSRGGLVQNISYTDVCIRNSRSPLVFDPYYSSATGTLIPDFRDITVKNVHVVGATGGRARFRGFDAAHPLTITLDNVVFDTAPTVTAQDAHLTLGPNPVTLAATGTNVTVTDGVSDGGAQAPRPCGDDAWVTF